MSKRKLLFITEGEIDEPKFIDKVFSKCYPNIEYDYYPYSTSIHTLSKLLFDKNGEIDEFLDIKNVLKENEKDEYKRKKLSIKYSDIVLVFDFDPHSDSPQFEKIKKMLGFFNDSTDNVKLYINYPMMQSYKHIKSYFDEDFKNRTVKISECPKYKETVNEESILKDLKKYNYPIIMKIIGFNLKKTNYLLNSKYEIPLYEEFNEIDLNKIYDIQCKMKNKNIVSVLNTFIFNILEYNPKMILKKVKDYELYEPKIRK